MSSALIPEFLLKDELVFEVRARGVEPATDVSSLRTQLRGLTASKFVTSWPPTLVVTDELEACRSKFEEWDGRVEELKDEPLTGRARSRAISRIGHLRGRAGLLATVGSIKGDDLAWLKQVSGSLDEMLAALGPKTQRTSEEPNVATEVTPVSRNEVSAEVGPAPASCSPIPRAPAQQTEPTSKCSGSLTSASYNKLPNPLTPLLQALPCVDGLEVHRLLKFLADLFRIREIPGVDDSLLLSLLIPYCRSPLSDLLNLVLSKKGNFEEFHRQTLQTFVPGRMREDLKMQMFYRSQGLRESLAAYCTEVRSASRVLRLDLSEEEVVQVILDGITPEERSRLVFCSKPVTFAELDQLVVTARNVQLIDQRRVEGTREANQRTPRALVGQVSMGSGDVPRRPVLICFGCGQRGHIRRFCRQQAPAVPKNGDAGGLPR